MRAPDGVCHVPTPTQLGPVPCGRPTAGDVCPTCLRDLAARLHELPPFPDHRGGTTPGLFADLDAAAARQAQFRRDGAPNPRTPDHDDPDDRPELGAAAAALPWNPTATAARTRILTALNTATDHLWAHLNPTAATHTRPPARALNPDDLAHWVADQLVRPSIPTQPWALTVHNALDRALTRAEHVCDRPDDRVRVECPTCGSRVPLDPDPDTMTRCRCGAWGVQAWWIDHAAPDRAPVRASALPLRLVAYGWDVSPDRVRQWVHRGKLQPTTLDDTGHALYDPAQAARIAAETEQRRRKVRPILVTNAPPVA